MRSVLAPLAVPTSTRGYTAAASSLAAARSVRLSLSKDATSSDRVAVFVADDLTLSSGTAAKAFDAGDRASWPPGCSLVATLSAGDVQIVPDEIWGPVLVALRVNGSTVLDLLVSGEGAQSRVTIAAPTTVGNRTAPVNITALSGPAQVAFAGTTAGYTAEVYLTDDSTIASGSGAPPASARLVGTITSGGPALALPEQAGYIIVRRTAGTAAVNVLVTGRDESAAPSVALTSTSTVALTAADEVTLTSTGASVDLQGRGIGVQATAGDANFSASEDINLTPGAAGSVNLRPRAAGAGDTGPLRFLELAANNFIGLQAPDALAASVTFVLPASDGTAGETLATNGARQLVFVSQPLQFGANAGLTTAAAHYLGVGVVPTAASSVSAQAGALVTRARTVRKLSVSFLGDAANVAGQTIVARALLDEVPIPGLVTTGVATTAGRHTAEIELATPVAVPAASRLTVSFTPSAPLTAAWTSAAAVIE